MKIYKLIDSLLSYGLNNNLINEYDYYYSLNALLSALNFKYPGIKSFTNSKACLPSVVNSYIVFSTILSTFLVTFSQRAIYS